MARLLTHTLLGIVFMMLVAGVLQSRLPATTGAPADAVAGVQSETTRAVARRAARPASYGEMELRRDGSGQFHADAVVNGEDIRFLVDTGADVVALTVDDAQRVGIDVDPSTFVPIGRTASGVGYGKPVRIERLELAGHEIGDVEAVVMEGLTTNLLGQSVLRRLGSVSLQGDTMVIRTD